MKFKPGDIVYHKATMKRGVVSELRSEKRVRVTNQDGESKVYAEVELWSEEEWNALGA